MSNLLEDEYVRQPKDIHLYFGLSYSNFLVLHRSILQSTPLDWQHRFTELMDELLDMQGREMVDRYNVSYTIQARKDNKFCKDPVPHYNRGRTRIDFNTGLAVKEAGV